MSLLLIRFCFKNINQGKVTTMKSVKIGIFDPYLDTLGGGEKYMLTAVVNLSSRYEVDIFWFPNEEEKIKKNAKIRFNIDFSKAKFVENIFSKKTSFIKRAYESKKYDYIIYLSDGSIPFIFCKKLFIHFQFPVEWVNGENTLTRLKMKRVSKVICNSEFTKKFIDKKFDIKSIVVYPPTSNKVDFEKKKKKIILSVGRYNRFPSGANFKKFDVLIEAFKNLTKKNIKGWKLILVISFKMEDEKYVEELIRLSQGYPIQILKNVDFNKISELYSQAKIYWHAAGYGEDVLLHPERAEHFGIATVEAMKYGVVPVVINAGGQAEIVTDGKNGFLWETVSELIKKTLILIEDQSLLSDISHKSEKRGNFFSQDKFCNEILEVIK